MAASDIARLLARTQTDYDGFNYAPIFEPDRLALLNVEKDILNAFTATDAARATSEAQLALTREAASSTGVALQAAAGSVQFIRDSIVGRRSADTALWSMLRATPSWNYGATGNLVEVPADTLPWDFDLSTGIAQGAAFSGARTNSVRNPRAEGSTTGVIGSGGVLPTNWAITSSATPTSVEVVGTGTSFGAAYVDLRFFGTPSSGAQVTINPEPFSVGAVASVGQTWTTSVWVQRIAGSTPNTNVNLRIFERQSGSGALTDGGASYNIEDGVRRFLTYTRTLTDSLVGRISSGLRFSPSVGVAYDVTYRFWLFQIEQGPFASLPSLPPVAAPAAFSRSQGTIDIPVRHFGMRYQPRQGTLIVEWSSLPGPFSSGSSSDWFGIASLGDQSGSEVMGLVVNPDHTRAEFWRVVGGTGQSAVPVTMTAPTAGQTIKIACAWDADLGLIQTAARGTAGTPATGQWLFPKISHFMPGRFGTTRPLFGRIVGVELRPGAIFNSALAAVT